jgi:hypothetical protein
MAEWLKAAVLKTADLIDPRVQIPFPPLLTRSQTLSLYFYHFYPNITKLTVNVHATVGIISDAHFFCLKQFIQ